MDEAITWLGEHQNELIELTIVSTTYLTAYDRNRLTEAHPNIINIIPQISSAEAGNDEAMDTIDLRKSVADLFVDFFKHKTGGQLPNEQLLGLLNEVLTLDEEI